MFICCHSYGQNADPTTLKSWQFLGFAKRYEVMGDKESAIKYYLGYLRTSPDAKVHLKVADLYYDVHDYKSASKIYKIYMNEPNDMGYLAKYKYAKTLKVLMEYDDAREIFGRFKEKTMNPTKLGINSEILSHEIKGCDLAISYRDTLVRTIIKPISGNINRWHTELAASYIDSQKIVFGTTSLDSLPIYNLENENSSPKIQVRQATKNDSSWTVNSTLAEPFNNFFDFNTGGGCFSFDKKRFYFSKGKMNWKYQTIYNLYVINFSDGKWGSPIEVGGNSNKKGFSSSQPTLGNCYDPELDVIYFVSNRDGGQGGTDIWYTVFNPSSHIYENAQNAGVSINTAGDELTPFFDLSSHCLYFSSNGWSTIGGLDVFKSSGDLVNWSEPKNIGVPINSSFDDLYFNLLPNSNKGLITSNRTDIIKRTNNNYFDDIFEFEESSSDRVWVSGVLYSDETMNENNIFKPTSKQATISSEEKYMPIIPIDSKKLSSIKPLVVEKPAEAVSSKETKALANVIISLSLQQDSSKNVFLSTQQTDSLGRFGFWVEKGNDLKIIVNNDSILNNEILFSTKQTNIDVSKITLATKPLKIISNKPIPLHNIYYDFDDDQVSAESKLVLDSTLILLMSQYPQIKIEIDSHTDNLGTDEYNNSLSLRRAKNVENYLISMGIDEYRIVAKGFGKTKPIASNRTANGDDSPEGRKMNRRTEFLILREAKP